MNQIIAKANGFNISIDSIMKIDADFMIEENMKKQCKP